ESSPLRACCRRGGWAPGASTFWKTWIASSQASPHGMVPTLFRDRKEQRMVNGKGRDRRGNPRVVVSKRWPDGSRFRRYVPNITIGKKILARIEESIAMGTWRALKEELRHEADEEETIRSFSEIYLDEYCRVRNRRPDFKEETLQSIVRILGDVKISEVHRKH